MTRRRSKVVVLNYHRVPTGAEPPHMLHTVQLAELRRHVERCAALGPFVTLEEVFDGRGLPEHAFLLTFDDVPAVSLPAMRELSGRGIPFAVSVCGQLAASGSGWRDKVYAICRHAAPERVAAVVAKATGEPARDPGGFSFYEYTKSGRRHPDEMVERIVQPLFEELPAPVREATLDRAYASWADVAELAADPLVTIANHSWRHVNFARLAPAERREDVRRAHAAIAAACGAPPRHFTVPFGYATQELLMDLTRLAREIGYRSVLWTEGRGNLAVEPHLGRDLQHLLRIDAPPTPAGFEKHLHRALAEPVAGPTAVLPSRPHGDRVTIESASDPARAAVLETLLRPDKDYAASRRFYDYAFAANPDGGRRPDFAIASSSAGDEAIAYAFHSSFAVGERRARGLYVASWRRMPCAGRLAGAGVFRRVVADAPVVGVSRPSADATAAIRGWSSVTVFEHVIDLGTARAGADADGDATRISAYDGSLDGIAAAATAGRFTVARDARFYRWRLDAYPLAASSYVVLCDGRRPVAFAALLTLRDAAAVADFAAPDPAHRPALFAAAARTAAADGARSLTVQTSCSALSAELCDLLGAHRTAFRNFYRVSDELLKALPAEARSADGTWDERFVHETHVTGDVLLR